MWENNKNQENIFNFYKKKQNYDRFMAFKF